jgi:hypothetical protein
MRSHYDRSFLPIPPAGSFAYAFADRRQPANPSIGPVLFHPTRRTPPTGGASAADEKRYCNGAWH